MPPSLADALGAYRDQLRPARPAGGRRPRRWRPWLAGALAAAVLAGGAATLLLPGDRRGAAAPAPTPPPAAAPGPAQTAGDGLAVPPPAAWRQWSSPVLRTWLPTVPGAGPGDPARLAGFSRTPAGALAAAVTLHPVVYYLRDRGAWDDLADRRVVWADGQREQLAAALEQVWRAGAGPAAEAVPVGYRMVSYSPDRARFRLWWRFARPDATTPVVGALVEVVWDGTDWRLFFDEPAMDMRAIGPADTYLPWGPR